MVEEFIRQVSVWAIPVLAAIVFHELAHGWVAFRLGDPTAARMGRLTLNPLSHIDLFGTVLLPLILILARAPFLFGYAKPVPVDYSNLGNPKRDMIWVALAGPLANLLLALVSSWIFVFLLSLEFSSQNSWSSFFISVLTPLALMARNSVIINVVLAIFNAFPIPPLDGGRVLVGLLPEPQAHWVARLEPYGMLIILVLLMTHVLDGLIGPIIGVVLGFLL